VSGRVHVRVARVAATIEIEVRDSGIGINGDRAIAAGFDYHLPKPLDPEKLIAVLTKLIRGEPDGAPARTA
jgi:CheY-like chemotaxis protein